MRVLILHSVRNLDRLRRTTLNQSFCLLKYAPEHEYTLHCYGRPIPPTVREGGFDALVIDTTFLWYRWSRPRSILADLLREYDFVRGWDIPKIALPQDDYDHCDVLDDWLFDWGIHAIFSPLAQHASLLYPRCSKRSRILPCLTGHVDVADVALAERWSEPFSERQIDVGYRAAELPAQFGRSGRLKSEIGARFVDALGPDCGLKVDVSTDPKDVFAGDLWLRFLGNSRFTLGAPSGSSLIDRRGLIQDAIREFLKHRPCAIFEEIEAACFPGEDDRVQLVGIGPRNIEAGLAQSCQILVPHRDLAPLEGDVHYIPLEPDCGNIDEVLAQMRDRELVAKRVAACRQLLVETFELGYPYFARRIVEEITRVRAPLAPAESDAAPTRLDAVLSLVEEQRLLVRLATAELDVAGPQMPDLPSSQAALSAQATAALKLRIGRMGAIRELFGINDDLDEFGNIVRLEPWPLPLRIYRRVRQLRSILLFRARSQRFGLAGPSLRILSGGRALGEGARLASWLRELARPCRDTLRSWCQWVLTEKPYWKQELRRSRIIGAAGALRLARGLPAALPKTATMIVADNAIDRRVLLSARALHQAGWKVTVIGLPYPNWPDAIDEDALVFPELPIKRINPYWPVRPPRRAAGLIERQALWREVFPYYLHFIDLALLAPAEIYVAHDLPALPAAATVAEALNAKLVYDAHELYPEQSMFEPDRVALLGRAERELIRRPRLVTTVNESIAQELSQRYAVPLPQIILNAAAVPTGGLPIVRSDLIRKKLGLSAAMRVLLFQGRLSLHRNLENLVAAMERVRTKDVVLVLMGPDGGVSEELHRAAAELQLLNNRVFFLDPVRQDELLVWTASADIGIIPYPPVDLNSRFCTPNKLFEFILAELPILANDLPELRRFVSLRGFGWNRPMDNSTAIARAIDEMCDADLAPFRAALRQRCCEFTWDVEGRKLVNLYEALRVGEVVALPESPTLPR